MNNNFINPNDAFRGKQGASELLGKLSRAQWDDWKARFAPQIQELARRAMDPGMADTAAAEASGAMATAFDVSQQAGNLQRQSFGLSLTPAQQAAQDRAAKVNRAAAMVSAGNQARISELDRQMAIMAGGMGISNIPGGAMQ